MSKSDRFRPVVTARGKTRIGSRKERIRIAQPVDRPITVRSRDVIQKEKLKESPWWFTEHRRGIYRQKIGHDPLERRAVSKYTVRGTLPERIVYKYLLFPLRMKPGIDFDFQTSLQGGRLELGGIVADFMFPYMMFILQVQGPTHDQHRRSRKDLEQKNILAEMGYTVVDVEDDDIYNEYKFIDIMHRLFMNNRQAMTQDEIMGLIYSDEQDDDYYVYGPEYESLEEFYANFR